MSVLSQIWFSFRQGMSNKQIYRENSFLPPLPLPPLIQEAFFIVMFLPLPNVSETNHILSSFKNLPWIFISWVSSIVKKFWVSLTIRYDILTFWICLHVCLYHFIWHLKYRRCSVNICWISEYLCFSCFQDIYSWDLTFSFSVLFSLF